MTTPREPDELWLRLFCAALSGAITDTHSNIDTIVSMSATATDKACALIEDRQKEARMRDAKERRR